VKAGMNEKDKVLLNSRIIKEVEKEATSHLTSDRVEKYSVRNIPSFIPVFLLRQLHKN
jgi:hypothetical protein